MILGEQDAVWTQAKSLNIVEYTIDFFIFYLFFEKKARHFIKKGRLNQPVMQIERLVEHLPSKLTNEGSKSQFISTSIVALIHCCKNKVVFSKFEG